MKRYIKRNWIVILGFLAFFFGIILQAGTGKIDGSVLIPLPLIYAALRLRSTKKTAIPTANRKSGVSKSNIAA